MARHFRPREKERDGAGGCKEGKELERERNEGDNGDEEVKCGRVHARSDLARRGAREKAESRLYPMTMCRTQVYRVYVPVCTWRGYVASICSDLSLLLSTLSQRLT